MILVSPSLAVTLCGASRLTTYCRRVVACQSKSQSAGVVRKISPVAGNIFEIVRSGVGQLDVDIAEMGFPVVVRVEIMNAHLLSVWRAADRRRPLASVLFRQ